MTKPAQCACQAINPASPPMPMPVSPATTFSAAQTRLNRMICRDQMGSMGASPGGPLRPGRTLGGKQPDACRHQARNGGRGPDHRLWGAPIEGQVRSRARHAADQEEQQEQHRPEPPRHDGAEGQQPQAVDGHVGIVIVKRHITEKGQHQLGKAAGPELGQSGCAITCRNERELADPGLELVRRDQGACHMRGHQGADQQYHHRRRTEDGLMGRVRLQEGHGVYLSGSPLRAMPRNGTRAAAAEGKQTGHGVCLAAPGRRSAVSPSLSPCKPARRG